jgi:ribulose-phosphate 3-epimerase
MLMALVCPTVTAYDIDTFHHQLTIAAAFADRIHLDFMDGRFAPTRSPELTHIELPKQLACDVHLMYEQPMQQLDVLIRLRPHMVIVHNEADVHHMHFAAALHAEGIKVGLAVLQTTPIEWAEQIMHSFDQILIFSGNLGHHGGTADLALLDKVRYVQASHPEVEIAWDGGIDGSNIGNLVDAGVHVLNVGGAIQKAGQPQEAYATLTEIVEQHTR